MFIFLKNKSFFKELIWPFFLKSIIFCILFLYIDFKLFEKLLGKQFINYFIFYISNKIELIKIICYFFIFDLIDRH